MRKRRTHSLTVQMLLEAVRNAPTSVQEYPNTREFDWTEPTRFVGDSMDALRDFTVKAARRIGDLMTCLLGSIVAFDEPELTQFYGAEARRIVAESSDYIMPLYRGGREVGVITLPTRCAVSWVQKLLGGGAKSAPEERDLSNLESEILLECVDTILAAVNEFFNAGEAAEISRGVAVRRKYEIAADKAETYVLIHLPNKDPESAESLQMLLPGEVLDQPAGLKTQLSLKTGSLSDADKMLFHVHSMPTEGRAILGDVELPMRAIMSLEPGDVLLTGRRVNQPIELMVEEIPLMAGYPVRSEWNYGLLVTARRGEEVAEEDDSSANGANHRTLGSDVEAERLLETTRT